MRKHLAAHAQSLGASAIAAVAPSYFKPKSLDVLIQWCARTGRRGPGHAVLLLRHPAHDRGGVPDGRIPRTSPGPNPDARGAEVTNLDLMTFQRVLSRRWRTLRRAIRFRRAVARGGRPGRARRGWHQLQLRAPIYNRLLAAAITNDLVTARAEQYAAWN